MLREESVNMSRFTLASYVPNPCIQKRGNVMVLHFSEEFH